jgi:excisionase family DNA binding protein
LTADVAACTIRRMQYRHQPLADPETFTTSAAAIFVGVAKRTIERWRADGTLQPAHRTAGGHSRYSREQLAPLRREYGDRAERQSAIQFPWNDD